MRTRALCQCSGISSMSLLQSCCFVGLASLMGLPSSSQVLGCPLYSSINFTSSCSSCSLFLCPRSIMRNGISDMIYVSISEYILYSYLWGRCLLPISPDLGLHPIFNVHFSKSRSGPNTPLLEKNKWTQTPLLEKNKWTQTPLLFFEKWGTFQTSRSGV